MNLRLCSALIILAVLCIGVTAQVGTPAPCAQPDPGLLDFVVLADTTGSMGPAIDSFRNHETDLVAFLRTFPNEAYIGVAEHRDVGDRFVFQWNLQLGSHDASTVRMATQQWEAAQGGDAPEAQLYAFHQIAITAPWRTSSNRVIVYFGDEEAHNPRMDVDAGMVRRVFEEHNIALLVVDLGKVGDMGLLGPRDAIKNSNYRNTGRAASCLVAGHAARLSWPKTAGLPPSNQVPCGLIGCDGDFGSDRDSDSSPAGSRWIGMSQMITLLAVVIVFLAL